MFLGISAMIIGSMIETIFIGLLGAAELAAYSFTFPLMMGLSSLSMGIGSGSASLIARAQGAGDRARVVRIATQSVLLTLLLVMILMAVFSIMLEPLFVLMGAGGEVLRLVIPYMQIWVLGLPLFTLPMMASTMLRAVGNARIPGYIMTFSAATQVIVSPILIFGLLGLPEFGLNGSAWANIAVGLARTVAMFVVVVGVERMLGSSGLLRHFVQDCREIFHIAIPSMLNSMVAPISMAVTIYLLAIHGETVVAAFGITSRFEMLIMMVLMSLSASIGPFVGQNFGARLFPRIYRGLWIAYLFCLAWGLLCFMVLLPFGDDLVAVINDAPTLVQAAGWYLAIVPMSFGPLGISMVSGALFIAIGKPLPTTVLALLRMIVLYLPLAILLDGWLGYQGIFLATLIANLLIGALAWYWSRRALGESIRALEHAG